MAATDLSLALLGPPVVRRDGAPVTFDTRKATALLALLAVTGREHSREQLAALLWPEADSAKGRASLRRTLSVTAAAMGDGLVISRAAVALDPALVRVDVREFEALIGRPDAASLERAASLYRDDFLAGFTLRGCAEFEEWQASVSEELRQALARGLQRLVAACIAEGALERAAGHARRWLQLDPLHEPAHQAIIRLHGWAGQRSAAMRQYRSLVRVLDRDLAVRPLPGDHAALRRRARGAARAAARPGRRSPRTSAEHGPAVRRTRQRTGLRQWARRGSRTRRWAAGGHAADLAAGGPDRRAGRPARGLAGGRRQQRGPWRRSARAAAQAAAAGWWPSPARPAAARRGSSPSCAPKRPGRAPPCWRPAAMTARPGCRSCWPPTCCGPRWRSGPTCRTRSRADRRDGRAAGPGAGRVAARIRPRRRWTARWRSPGCTRPSRTRCRRRPARGGCDRETAVTADPARAGIVVVEDVHWADSSSLGLLAYLVRRLADWPLLLVLSWQPEQAGRLRVLRTALGEAESQSMGQTVEPGPLGPEAIGTLLGLDGMPRIDVSRLLAETRGLPMLVREYVEALRAAEEPEAGRGRARRLVAAGQRQGPAADPAAGGQRGGQADADRRRGARQRQRR